MRRERMAALRLMCGSALALLAGSLANAQPGKVDVPPMPAEVIGMGDPDAACMIASFDMFALGIERQNELPANERESMLEVPQRQIGFYAGRLSARLGNEKAQAAIAPATLGYFDKTKVADIRPTRTWCFRSYLDLTGTVFPNRMDRALSPVFSNKKNPSDYPAIKPEDLDPDALCMIAVSTALPLAMEATKSNPAATRNVGLLGRAQHFYMGRLDGTSDPGAVEGNIAQAYIYSGQQLKRGDQKTAEAEAQACVLRYGSTLEGLKKAAASAVPASRSR